MALFEIFENITPSKITRYTVYGGYVDGISITSGNLRKHEWTYAVGLNNDESHTTINCPCAKYLGPVSPAYVGSHYYCESGNTGDFVGELDTFYNNDPLWDEAGCLSENSCCYDAGMLWFFRQFPVTTTDDVEMRICYDEGFDNEGAIVEQIQLYVQ